MKILVLGGFGFLGGRIVQYFLNKGHDVYQGTSRDLISKNFTLGSAQPVKIFWDNKEKLNDICKNIDLIIHAYGMNAQDCINNPVGAYELNTLSTVNILQAAIKANVRRFVYISTIHVYTNVLEGKITELDHPTNAHPYASSHRSAEDAVLWAQKNKLIDGIVLRVSNGFGSPINKDASCWKLLVNDLCRQAVEYQILELKSNGSVMRNFIPIKEICSSIDYIACNLSLKKNVGQIGPINIGAKKSLSILEIAKLIQSRCKLILGYTPELSLKVKKLKKKSFLDFKTKRLKSLGYLHKYSLEEEIDELLTYCYKSFNKW